MKKTSLFMALKENKLFFLFYFIFMLCLLFMSLFLDKGQEVIWMAQRRSAFFNQIFLFITRFGEEHIFVLMVIIMALRDSYRNALQFSLAGILSLLISFGSKALFASPRPMKYFSDLGRMEEMGSIPEYVFHVGYTSFPSGHTMGAFAFFTLIALYHKKNYWEVIAILFAMLVALSRVYLGQHFIEDLMLGSFLGILIALFVHYLFHGYWKNIRWMDLSIIGKF